MPKIQVIRAGTTVEDYRTDYQKNLEKAVEVKPTWYKGEKPTSGEVLARIAQRSEFDPQGSAQSYSMFKQLQQNKASQFYNPYTQPTNAAVGNLKAMGVDVSDINDDWFNKYSYLKNYYKFGDTTNTPNKPGKKASLEEKAAYEYYQLAKSEEGTKKAETQLNALQEFFNYWANRADRNLTDEELIDKVDWSQYGALLSMEENAKRGTPTELNRAVNFSRDYLPAMIWAARNGGGTGDMDMDLLNSIIGAGNQWELNEFVADKLTPGSPGFNPYAVGSTNLDDAAVYFGVDSFEEGWTQEHADLAWSKDETERKMFQQVLRGEETQQKASEEYTNLYSWVHSKINNKRSADWILSNIDWSDYPTLSAMDKSIGKDGKPGTGDLLPMARGLDYKYDDLKRTVESLCAIRDDKQSTADLLKEATTPDTTTATTTGTAAESTTAPTTGTETAASDGGKTVVDINQEANTPEQYDSIHGEGAYERDIAEAAAAQNFGFDTADMIPKNVTNSTITTSSTPSAPVLTNKPAVTTVKSSGIVGSLTDTDIEELKKKDANAQEAAGALDGYVNETEGAYLTYDSQASDMVSDYLEDSDPQALAQTNIQAVGASYGSDMVDLTVKNNAALQAQTDIEEAQKNLEAINGEIDRIENGIIASEYELENLNSLKRNPPLEAFAATRETANGQEQTDALLFIYRNVTEDYQYTYDQYANDPDAQQKAKMWADYILSDGDFVEETITPDDLDRLPRLNAAKTQNEKTTTDGEKLIADSAESVQRYNERMLWMDSVIDEYEKEGIDTTDLKAIKGITAYFGRVSNYKSGSGYSIGHYGDMASKEDADKDYAESKAMLDDARWAVDFAAKNGINLPDSVREKMVKLVHDLELDGRDYYYYSLQYKSDFQKMVEEGKKIEADDPVPLADFVHTYKFDPNDPRSQVAHLLQDMNHFDLMTDAEKDTYYYLLAKEDREIAGAYLDFLNSPDYGVLQARNMEATREQAQEEVNSGVVGAVWANIKAIGSAPLEAISSLGYLAYTLISDADINENNEAFAMGTYSQEVNAATMQSINDTFKEHPVAGKVATGLYEIIYNRGRSMMNSVVSGPMVELVNNPIVKEVAGALPMGMGAAAMTIADAKGKDATEGQAYLLGLVTLVSETFSEGLTFGNIQETISKTSGFDPSTVKELVIDWLTKNGVEEVIGEVSTDWAQNWSDETILGIHGEHGDRVAAWYQKLKEENPNLLDDEIRQMAEDMADKDEFAGYIHTAVISYLSAGMDIPVSLIRSSLANTMNYRMDSNVMRDAGFSMSIKGIREMYANREEQLKNAEAAKTEAPATEAPTAKTKTAENAQVETPDVNAEAKQKTGSVFAKDASVLNAVEGKSAAVETAGLATILRSSGKRSDVRAAKAAAIGMNKMFGDQETATRNVKSFLAGAHVAGVPVEEVKAGLKIAALSPHSRTAMIINSDQFKNATPAQQAIMIAGFARLDANNPMVKAEMDKSYRESVAAELVTSIMADGGGKSAVDADAKVASAKQLTQKAEADKESSQADYEAKGQNLQTANEQLQQDPGSHPKADQFTHSLNEYENASVVNQQMDQQLENAREKQQAVEAETRATKEEAVTTARQQANQTAEAEAQQEAQEEAQAKADAEAQQTAATQAQAEQDERTGKTWENTRDQLIDEILDNEYLEEGERREARRKELTDRANMIREGRIDMAGMVSNAEGILAVGMLGRQLGLDIVYTDDEKILPKNAKGKYENGVVYLNQNMIQNGKMTVGQAVMEIALHEFTHSMEGTKQYAKYSQTVLDFLFQGDDAEARLQAAIDSKIQSYREEFGQELTPEKAKAEIVADFAKNRLNDREVAQRFLDAGIAGRVRNALHNINQAIKNFRLTGTERETAEYLRRAERMYQKMISQAARSSTHPDGDQFSLAQLAEATGLDLDLNTLELRTPDGALVDGVVNRIKPEMLDNTPVGMLIDLAQNGLTNKNGKSILAPTISKETAKAQKKMFADLANMVAQYKDSDLVWEIASSTLFSAMKANSDPQYSTTVDFGTICAKTQEIINVMSQVMLEKGRGLTRDEVLQVYNETANAGLTVPCPVCYVFSRWMGVPSLLGQMSKYQKRFVVTNADGSINVAKTQDAANDYIKAALEKYGDKEGIDDAKTSINNRRKTQEKNREEALKVILSDTATEEEKAAAQKKHDEAIKTLVDLDNELGEVEAFNWVTQALCKQKREGRKTVNVLDADGNYVIDEAFELTPDDVLFDLRKTGEFAKFTKNWSYRNTRGAGMGKAIMPYSGETIGDIIYGTSRKLASANPFLTLDPQTAANGISKAIVRAMKQNLIGGQRLQSTSDFRPEWGLDYLMSFLELQAIGSKVQMYTKVAEAVPLLASMGADINLSIMGKGKGWHIDDNGNYVLDFSDVTGMKYETAKALKNDYSNVQMILVGMNDTHIRLAIADSDIDFVIPWHASGNSKDTLASLVSSASIGQEQLETSSDYTETQSDKASENQTPEQKQLWNLRMKILQGKKINAQERDLIYTDKYLAPLYERFNVEGKDADCYHLKLGQDQAKQIFPYEYWNKGLTKDQADANGKAFVDYCQHFGIVPRFSGTVRTAEEGKFFTAEEVGSGKPLAYDSEGRVIRFEQNNFAGAIRDENGNITGYGDADKGYWKLLIDRPMYDNDGNYREQQVVDVTKAKIGSLENGKLVNSDMPLTTSAMYGPNYSDKEKTAVDNSLAAIQEQSDLRGGGQLSDGGASLADIDVQQVEQDYEDAVARGDMEAAQADVDYTAEQAMPNSKVRTKDGNLLNMYHGTNADFTEFRRDMIGSTGRFEGSGFNFTPYEGRAKSYGKNVLSGYLDISNPLSAEEKTISVMGLARIIREADPTGDNIIADYARQTRDYGSSSFVQRESLTAARSIWEASDNDVDIYSFISAADSDAEGLIEKFSFLGYDGLIHYDDNGEIKTAIAFNSSQFKSSAPVTYDDQGNIIPLGQRFTDSPDIRYSDGGASLTDIDQTSSQPSELSEQDISRIREEATAALSSPFAKEYDAWDKTSTGKFFDLGKPAKALIKYGMPDVAIRISGEKLNTILNDHHGMTETVIKQIPNIVADPLIIIPSHTVPGRITAFGEVMDDDGFPVLAALSTNIQKDVVNDIEFSIMNSAYGKNFLLQNFLNKSQVIIVDKNRADAWAGSLRVEFPSTSTVLGSDGEIITQPNPTVKQEENDTVVYNETAYLKDSTIDKWLRDYAASNPNYAQAYIAYINPDVFLDLTTVTMNSRRMIYDQTGPFDEEHMQDVSPNEPMFLRIDGETGEIYGHEGRHRAVAMSREGIKQVPVLVFDFDSKYTKTPLDSLLIRGQSFNDGAKNHNKTTLHDVIPLSTGNREQIIERFTAPMEETDGKRTLQYSDGGTSLTELDQTLVNSGVITQEELDAYQNNVAGRPLEGENPMATTMIGNGQRQFGSENGMLNDSDEMARQAIGYVMNQNGYTPDTNAAQLDRAMKWIRSNKSTPNSDGLYEALQQVINNNFDYRSADGQARMIALMGMAAAKNDILAQSTLADAFNRQGTDLGRMLQARKLFRLMTPEGRKASLENMAKQVSDEFLKNGYTTDIKFSDWVLNAAAAAQTEEEFDMVRDVAAKEIAEQVPSNWKDRFRTWRMLSMLGNPRTHFRNLTGNAIFMPVVKLKNIIGAGIEEQYAKRGLLKEGERTKAVKLTEDAKIFAAEDADKMRRVLTGESKYGDANRVKREMKPFGDSWLQKLADFNSDMLEKEDWLFLNHHYQTALASYMTANGWTHVDMKDQKKLDAARAYAVLEAQKATYRDANKISDKLNQWSRDGGFSGFLVDATLPFKKTPANILRRGIEYSPVGLIKSLAGMKRSLEKYSNWEKTGFAGEMPKGAKTLTQALDDIAAGASGTLIAAIGAALSALGAVKLKHDSDDDEDRLDVLEGSQDYSIEMFGLSMTLDWAAPVCMPFFTGAAIYQSIADMADGDVDIGAVIEGIAGITDPVFNLSMLDGVSSLIKSVSYSKLGPVPAMLSKIGANYATSYVPSFFGAVARTADDTRRKAFTESGAALNDWLYGFEQAQNKIPYLSTLNIPYRNEWGEPDVTNRVWAFMENFVFPGYVNKVRPTTISENLRKIYTATGEDVLNSATPKKLGGESLTDKEYDLYAVTSGQTAQKLLTQFLEIPENAALIDTNPDALVPIIGSIYSFSNFMARKAVQPSYTTTTKWLNAAAESDDPLGIIMDQSEQKAKQTTQKQNYEGLYTSINNNDAAGAATSVQGLKELGKKDSDIRSQLTKKYKQAYIDAYLAGEEDDTERIEAMLTALDLGNSSYEDTDFSDWLKGLED